MKKIFMLMASFAVLFSACDPNEEIYEELDALKSAQTGKVAAISLTLTEKEYGDAGNDQVKANKYFVSEDEAKEYIPVILGKKAEYKLVGPGSSADVTYDLFQEPVMLNAELLTSYTVTIEDYDSQGGNVARNDNFSSTTDIIKFLNTKYPEAVNNTPVDLTYDYNVGGGVRETRTNMFVVVRGAWTMPYLFSADDYEEVGNGRFKNFGTQAQAEYKIGQYLNVHNPYVSAGEGQGVIYKLHIGGGKTEDRLAYYTFNGSTWDLWAKTIQQTMKLSFDGTVWIPDNTIKYTLTDADYVAIGEAYAGTPYGDNLKQYKNFNLNEGNWTDALILEGIGNRLKTLYPDAQEGQKFVVTYATFKSGVGTSTGVTLELILKDGIYVKQ